MAIYRGKPYRVRQKKSILKSRFFWIFVLILIVGLAIFYFLIFSPVFQIKEIKISGLQKVLTNDIENLVWQKIKKKILFFKSKSIFLISLNEIKNSLLREFPKIGQVALKRNFPNALSLEIQERKPAFVFCNSDCFLIDKKGIIFDAFKNNISREVEGLPIIKSQKVKEIVFGEKIFEEDFLARILEVQKKIEEKLKIKIGGFLVSEEKLTAKTAEDWKIYFNLKGDLNWPLTELFLILEKQIPPERRGNLEYIDLRFSRVYYKYK